MEIESRRSYSKEFKANAVELMLAGESNIEEIASDLGVPVPNLFRWRREALEQSGESLEGAPKSLKPAELEQENRRLRRELEKARLERDILKKTVNIFSRPNGSE